MTNVKILYRIQTEKFPSELLDDLETGELVCPICLREIYYENPEDVDSIPVVVTTADGVTQFAHSECVEQNTSVVDFNTETCPHVSVYVDAWKAMPLIITPTDEDNPDGASDPIWVRRVACLHCGKEAKPDYISSDEISLGYIQSVLRNSE